MKLELGYIVCYEKGFKDLTNNHIYQKEDLFPFDNSELDQNRIKELITTNNKIGKKLIRPRLLSDCTDEELEEIAKTLQIKVESMDREDIIQDIGNSLQELRKIKKNLQLKKIPFEDNASLEELKGLLENAK